MSSTFDSTDSPSARDKSPMETAEDVFLLLVSGPHPLSINGRLIPGLSSRRIPLHQIRARMYARKLRPRTQDLIWGHVVYRARNHHRESTHSTAHPSATNRPTGPVENARGASTGAGAGVGGSGWTVAAVGLALPVLSRTAVNIALSYGGDPADIEAAVLAGFLIELHRTDVSEPGILTRLRAAAHRSGTAMRDTLTPATPSVRTPVPSTPPASRPTPSTPLPSSSTTAPGSRP